MHNINTTPSVDPGGAAGRKLQDEKQPATLTHSLTTTKKEENNNETTIPKNSLLYTALKIKYKDNNVLCIVTGMSFIWHRSVIKHTIHR